MLTGTWLENLPALAIFALALLIIARSFRTDAVRYARLLERRVDELAKELATERSRRRRLERFLRGVGLVVPDEADDEDETAKEAS